MAPLPDRVFHHLVNRWQHRLSDTKDYTIFGDILGQRYYYRKSIFAGVYKQAVADDRP